MSEHMGRMSAAIRNFVRSLDLADWDCVPKLYFEFTDMYKMKRAEVIILQELEKTMMFDGVKRKLDVDAVEIEFGGVLIVLRCMARIQNMQGLDVGYRLTPPRNKVG